MRIQDNLDWELGQPLKLMGYKCSKDYEPRCFGGESKAYIPEAGFARAEIYSKEDTTAPIVQMSERVIKDNKDRAVILVEGYGEYYSKIWK